MRVEPISVDLHHLRNIWMMNWAYLPTDWQKRQSSVGGFQNQPQNWPNSSFGSKIGFGQLAKQQSTAPGLKISSHLRLMFGSCVHSSSIQLQFTHNTPTHTQTLCVCDLPCKWQAACLCLALCLVFCVITSEKKWYVWPCVSV